MMSRKISVVIPCKDRPEPLHRALVSVCEQMLVPDEIVIVDDGSEPPLTLNQQYTVPVTIIQQRNQGPAAARNRGVREASGEWIALLDSDDVWFPDKLATQWRLIAQHPSVGFCASNMVRQSGPPVGFPLSPASGEEGLIEDALDRLLPGRFVPTSGVMFRKDVFVRVGEFDECLWYCEDYDLWLRLAAATVVVASARCLGECFREGDNLSQLEQTPAASEAGVYILEKVMASDLFDKRAQRQAAMRLGRALYDLAYSYRKHGRPIKCCAAAWRSLRHAGPVTANLKNFLYCWPELLLVRERGL
jgi:glycosyltransferase involved in cell wall biosynthesis